MIVMLRKILAGKAICCEAIWRTTSVILRKDEAASWLCFAKIWQGNLAQNLCALRIDEAVSWLCLAKEKKTKTENRKQ